MVALLIGALAGCGDQWTPGSAPHTESFPLLCEHEAASCESCHPADQPIGKVDSACVACHVEDRPVSHDPATTNTCDECHVDDACGWNSASPHPAGFSEPESHGLEAKLGGPTEGACTECHGADLRGGTTATGASARGCDECHADNGHEDWRTDCVFCHGGERDQTGAPPLDIDGSSTDISFPAHSEHVGVDGTYRALECLECHTSHNDAMSPGHWFDGTNGVGELTFANGIAEATTMAGDTCSNNYCHGQGQRHDGSYTVGGRTIDDTTCDECHATSAPGWSSMSGLHATHLTDDTGISCNDCHANVIDADDRIDSPDLHVDGVRQISFIEPAITTDNNGGTCQGTCHGTLHDPSFGWGHVSNYEEPELHGYDTNMHVLDCGSCHGSDWTGGIAQGCDDCHATEGFAGWRTDCTFCHGGANGDTDGLPPVDMDGVADPSLISFQAHGAHHGSSPVNGHPAYDCVQCHATPNDALSPGHVLDGTDGHAEVDLSNGWSWEGGYDPTSGSCSNMYCHGNGQTPSGTIADGATALDCDSCHRTTADGTNGWTAMSGTHDAHLQDPTVTCADCHDPVVDATGKITTNDLHVDRSVTVDLATTGWSAADTSCTNNCHNVSHEALPWAGAHPDGYEQPEMHGQEALLRLQTCTACHGANLEGASGDGCDGCHADEGHPDWRGECTFCHGGADGDIDGAPPEDIDNEIDPARISFQAHRTHLDGDDHAAWDCAACHSGAASYGDAPTDAGHWLLDSTPQVADVDFTGVANASVYAAGNCSNNYCHGNGQANGESVDGVSLTCDGCHSYAFTWTDMSGTHASHLSVTGIACADCHSNVINATGTITAPNRHVNGAIDVSSAGITVNNGADGYTCTGTCHTQSHTAWTWAGGHPPGYEAPEIHGQEALFQDQECRTCHGYDALGGSSGQACNSCHPVGWRTDCTFCHGGSLGDTDGLPPSDLDNNTDEATISFMAHPEHYDGDDHLAALCEDCHDAASYVDAWDDAGHWWDDGSPGAAEVDMSGGLSSASTYDPATSTCSNNYCHGTGKANGSETDSANGLACNGCHGNPPNTGDHNDHIGEADCSDCHPDANGGAIDVPTQHVNGVKEVADGSGTAIVFTWNGSRWTCNGTCHDGHSNDTW